MLYFYSSSFPGVVHDDGTIRFQCHGKKTAFFKIALVSQIVLLSMHGLLSMGAIMWCLFFRLDNKIEKAFQGGC